MLSLKFAVVIFLASINNAFGKDCGINLIGTKCRCAHIEGYNDVTCSNVNNIAMMKTILKDLPIYELSIVTSDSKIQKDYFKGLNSVRQITLRGLEVLEVIEDGAFNGLENSLNDLVIYGNRMKKLPNLNYMTGLETLFATIKNHDGKFAQDNIDLLPPNIKKLSIANSYYKSISGNFSKFLNLRHLVFAKGAAETLDDIIVGPNVRTIDIRYNRLKSFSLNFMKRLPNDFGIAYGFNSIKSFTKEEIEVIIEKNLNIPSNGMIFSCPCDMSWIIEMKEAVAKKLGNFECSGNSIRTFKKLLQLTDLSFQYC